MLNRIVAKKFKKKTFSQCGEDIIIKFIFDNIIKIPQPTYIDIGANHPFDLNNTYLFYLNGSSGLNIDANTDSIDLFNKYRKKDININIGISDSKGELDFYKFKYSTYNTFDLDEAEKQKHALVEVKKIEVNTINFIIEKYFNAVFPDFLSLDVEGLDYKILKTIDFSKGPKVICVETIINEDECTYQNTEIIDFLVSSGYLIHSSTLINTIFIKGEYLRLC
jgi:FkbM family methyltransferase